LPQLAYGVNTPIDHARFFASRHRAAHRMQQGSCPPSRCRLGPKPLRTGFSSRGVAGLPHLGIAQPPLALASRLPYGARRWDISSVLQLIERGKDKRSEPALVSANSALRLHEQRIGTRGNIPRENAPRALAPEMAAAMADGLKTAGFTYVPWTFEGYRPGLLSNGDSFAPSASVPAKAAAGT